MAHAGKSVSAPVNARLLTTLQGMLSSEEDVVRTYAARTLGIVSLVRSPTYRTTLFLFQDLRLSPTQYTRVLFQISLESMNFSVRTKSQTLASVSRPFFLTTVVVGSMLESRNFFHF